MQYNYVKEVYMKENLSFNEKCYELLKKIPRGKVTTYKEMARALNTKAYRAVGSAMAKNKNLIIIPCHRVIPSSGMVGNYALGKDKKIELLKKEGLSIENDKILNLEEVFFKFTQED